MTDITELAQQEMAQLRDELLNQEIGSKDHLRKIALSLLDKLEKCRDREIRWLALSDEKSKIITDQEEALAAEKRICATWRKTAESTGEKLEKAQETIAFQQGEIKALLSSLESRTVKLPDEVDVLLNHLEDVLPFEVFQLIDAHKWNAVSRLSAAGIKVEAE